jgi:hypothetical protein
MSLPTREQIFTNTLTELDAAYRALGNAQDWLRSDWQPVGSSLTNAQGDARSAMQDAIAKAKAAVNKAKDAGYRGADDR